MRPRKSKAWIIVLIVVIILVAVVYALFSNREQIFGTKNSEKITKTFSPLLGSSKKKDVVDPNNTQGSNTNTTPTNITTTTDPSGSFGNGDGFNTGNGLGSGDGFGNTGGSGTRNDQGGSNYTPPLNPLPTPGSSAGGSAGAGGTITLGDPIPVPPVRITPPDPNFCPNDQLVFTDAEKEELASLLRQYYLIAPTIKNSDDLILVNNDISANQALLNQVTTLTNQCTTQKSSFSYGGPQIVKDNPYYDDPTNTNAVPYISLFSQLEDIFKIW